MGALDNASSMEGDVYVQRLATCIRRNEEALANGLLCYSKVRSSSQVKPLRPSLTTHHLYYILERIENSALDVEVGPLNVKLDNPNHEPTFISFMANNARSQHHFESDANCPSRRRAGCIYTLAQRDKAKAIGGKWMCFPNTFTEVQRSQRARPSGGVLLQSDVRIETWKL